MYKTRKVFDCQDMPNVLRKEFFSNYTVGNDCYVDWECTDESMIDTWLILGGAERGEIVLIRHWW